MSIEVKPNLQLEIAHVLFIDIVGYSKLLIDEQREWLQELNDIVRRTEVFRTAEASGQLSRIPTGDGMALVFTSTPEAPVRCALEISKALKTRPELRVRMGIHSGPVSGITDVNGQTNIAGGGINTAQRVMDCGDAGHILLSKRVAEDLAQYRHWQPLLHDLGECKVKHDMTVSVVNLYTDEVGNPSWPAKLARASVEAAVPAAKQGTRSKLLLLAGVVIIAFAAAFLLFQIMGTGRWPIQSKPENEGSRSTVSVAPTAAPSIAEKSIAVLPFENLSGNPENAYFAEGVQDEILTNLAKIADLKVISRTSVMQYKTGITRNLREIGQQLGVAHLLEGSVQRSANRVRVNAQLIDARTDAHLWAQTYDRDLADVFAIQSEIAKTIADQLQARLSPTEKMAIEQPPTADLTAFTLYSRAKTLVLTTSFSAVAKQNLLQAVDLLNQAITRDPQFFFAYCLLADANSVIYQITDDHTAARRALAETAMQSAARLRPDAGETHFARADFLYTCDRDFEHALAELDLAASKLPNNSQIFEFKGYIKRRQGDWDESTRDLEKALELDPRNFYILQQIALSYIYLHRYADVASVLERALVLVPSDIDTRVARARVDLDERGDPKPLHATIHAIVAAQPSAAEGLANDWFFLALCERDPAETAQALNSIPASGLGTEWNVFSRVWCAALAAKVRGDADAARSGFTAARTELQRKMGEQPEYGPLLCVLGLTDAALGRKEDAIREGRRAVELIPPIKDSISGAQLMKYLAVIYAWTDEKDRAIEQIAATLQIPGDLSYGQLKLHPYWDVLRGDPRFEKIVASLAPKDAK
jgi:serine/threonine-protein kinase